jgi:hypothetical protein
MNTKLIGITFALAVTLAGAVSSVTAGAATKGVILQPANTSNSYAMRMDRCPYYPSPVVCRSAPAARATSDSVTSA